jgi:hypothetical protein
MIGAGSVTLDGIPATCSVVSAREITTTVPAGAAIGENVFLARLFVCRLSFALTLGLIANSLTAQTSAANAVGSPSPIVSFNSPRIYPGGVQSIAKGDFNGDGKPDLAVANNSSDSIYILLGGQNGTFQQLEVYQLGLGSGQFHEGVVLFHWRG